MPRGRRRSVSPPPWEGPGLQGQEEAGRRWCTGLEATESSVKGQLDRLSRNVEALTEQVSRLLINAPSWQAPADSGRKGAEIPLDDGTASWGSFHLLFGAAARTRLPTERNGNNCGTWPRLQKDKIGTGGEVVLGTSMSVFGGQEQLPVDERPANGGCGGRQDREGGATPVERADGWPTEVARHRSSTSNEVVMSSNIDGSFESILEIDKKIDDDEWEEDDAPTVFGGQEQLPVDEQPAEGGCGERQEFGKGAAEEEVEVSVGLEAGGTKKGGSGRKSGKALMKRSCLLRSVSRRSKGKNPKRWSDWEGPVFKAGRLHFGYRFRRKPRGKHKQPPGPIHSQGGL